MYSGNCCRRNARNSSLVGSLFGDQVGGQPLLAGLVFVGKNHVLLNGGMLLNYGFDLRGFDAEAANLNLVIDPSHKLDVAIGQEACQVAGAIESSRSVLRKRMRE